MYSCVVCMCVCSPMYSLYGRVCLLVCIIHVCVFTNISCMEGCVVYLYMKHKRCVHVCSHVSHMEWDVVL